MTVPRLVTLLRSLGILISKRQVVRMLIEGQDGFLSEARDVLRDGLSSAAWIWRDLLEQIAEQTARINARTGKIKVLAAQADTARRLQTIPGAAH